MRLDIRNKLDPHDCIDCDFVVDFGENHELIGIEYVDYNGFLRGASVEKIEREYAKKAVKRISFDGESGCIYVRIRDGESIDQKVVSGFICKDSMHNIVAMVMKAEDEI